MGVWLNIVWNVLGSLLCVGTFYFVKKRLFLSNEYERMQESADETATTVDEKPKLDRKSVSEHVMFLLKYAVLYWPWFSAACLFLVIYSTGMPCFIYVIFIDNL